MTRPSVLVASQGNVSRESLPQSSFVGPIAGRHEVLISILLWFCPQAYALVKNNHGEVDRREFLDLMTLSFLQSRLTSSMSLNSTASGHIDRAALIATLTGKLQETIPEDPEEGRLVTVCQYTSLGCLWTYMQRTCLNCILLFL